MPRHPNQQPYVADGFILDCDELMFRCIQVDSLSYHVFCNIWKDMKMHSIFLGRPRGAELGELSEEVIHVAKRYLVGDYIKVEESIAGLFLIYALLNLQPYKNFAHLRLVAEDIEALRNIEGVARREHRIDVLYILGSVLIKGPVRYVAAPREYGMEFSVRKYIAGYAGIETKSSGKGVFFRNREELDIIREVSSLYKKYIREKNMLIESGKWNKNLNYTNESLGSELENGLKNLMTGCGDLKDQDNESEEVSQPKLNARAIKEKAMTGTVNPMRHLVAVTDRQSPTKKPPQVSPVEKPVFKVPSSPHRTNRQTFTMLRPKKIRKFRYNCDFDDDDTDDEDEAQPSASTSRSRVDPDAIDKEIETEEQEINIQIDNLPIFSRVVENGQQIEIEVIDNFKGMKKEKSDAKAKITKAFSGKKVKIEDIKKIEILDEKIIEPPKAYSKKEKPSPVLPTSELSTTKSSNKNVSTKSLPSIEDINSDGPSETVSKDTNLKNKKLIKDENEKSKCKKSTQIEIEVIDNFKGMKKEKSDAKAKITKAFSGKKVKIEDIKKIEILDEKIIELPKKFSKKEKPSPVLPKSELSTNKSSNQNVSTKSLPSIEDINTDSKDTKLGNEELIIDVNVKSKKSLKSRPPKKRLRTS